MVRPFASAVVSASLLACGPAAPPVSPPRPPEPPPAVTPPPPPLLKPSAEPAPPPRPAAKIGVPIDGRFALAVDCAAYDYRVGAVGKGLLGVCGEALEASTVFHVPATGAGAARLAPEIFKGLSPRTGNPGSTLGVTWIRGADLEHLDVDITEIRTRTGYSWTYRRTGTAWKTVEREAFAGGEGGPTSVVIGKRELALFIGNHGENRFAYIDQKPGWIPAATRPAGCPEFVRDFSLLRVKGKDLWGMGVACGKLAAQRWNIGGTDTVAMPLDLPGTPHQGWTTVLGETWIYVAGDGSGVARFDGRTWESLGELPVKVFGNQPFLAGGRLWFDAERRLFRLAGARFEEVAVPDGGVRRLALTDAGEIRVVTDKALYTLGADDTWIPVTVSVPVDSIYEIRHLAGRWFLAAHPGDKNDRIHLHVEGASGPPVTITAPAALLSPFSFVQALHGYCERPFALLYKLARTAPADYDFPATRKALEGHADLAAGRFSEVKAFDDRYLIARYQGPGEQAALARLAALVQAKVPGSKPQLLCADRVQGELPTVRDVPMK